MFSYRHSFHAGNHADVLKHAALLAVVRYLVTKPTSLMCADTHAGAALYRLGSHEALTSGEASLGVGKIWQDHTASRVLSAPETNLTPSQTGANLDTRPAGFQSSIMQDYLQTLQQFNRGTTLSHYPGSPLWLLQAVRPIDKLKLFEMHPTDSRLLAGEMRKQQGAPVEVIRDDGFMAIKRFFPPPSRRGLVVCDPSYELKTDYARVQALLVEGLQRFPTATYFIWYPLIARPEAHGLPKRLKTLASHAGKPWLNATLTVRGGQTKIRTAHAHSVLGKHSAIATKAPGGGLGASGIFVLNPPFTLKAQLQQALPEMKASLAQDEHAGFSLESA